MPTDQRRRRSGARGQVGRALLPLHGPGDVGSGLKAVQKDIRNREVHSSQVQSGCTAGPVVVEQEEERMNLTASEAVDLGRVIEGLNQGGTEHDIRTYI